MRVTSSREYWWEMGHSLMHHKGKCYNAHGHNYRMEVEISIYGGMPDEVTGMVWDFGNLDDLVKPVIKKELDHKFYFNKDDERFRNMTRAGMRAFPKEPTAENLGFYLWHDITANLNKASKKANIRLILESVTIYETDKSKATIRRT